MVTKIKALYFAVNITDVKSAMLLLMTVKNIATLNTPIKQTITTKIVSIFFTYCVFFSHIKMN